MIGTKFYKGNYDSNEYTKCAMWCNSNGKATIEDKGEYYECVEIIIPLSDIKESKLNQLKHMRDTEELSPVEANGYKWDFDDKAQQRITGAITVLEMTNGSLTWTSADNEEIENVDATMLKQVVAAAAARSNAVHIKYRVLKAAVEAATTEEEVAAVVW